MPAARCGRCLRKAPLRVSTLAPFQYRAPVDALILAFKRGGDLANGRLLAHLLAEAARSVVQPQALVPVPLHISRVRERGFDQAKLLARDLARELALPVISGLRRVRATPHQFAFDKAGRKRNVRGAFAAEPELAGYAHIALVDDVATTGSTLEACALAALRAGVQRVDAWVVARA